MEKFIIAAQTIDGFIARDADHLSTRWTSKEDAAFFTETTQRAGVCIMGATTFRTINRPLPGRLTIVYTRNPEEFAQFDDSEVRTTQAKPEDLLKELEEEGFNEVAICGGSAIYTMFMEAGLVDSMYLTKEPVVFGKGVPLFNRVLDIAGRLILNEVIELSEQTKVFHYLVNHAAQN